MSLRDVLAEACELEDCSLRDLTVLATQNDPFRVDTPAGHRDGEWLAVQAEKLGDQQIHLRGLHYMVIGEIKPDGKPYTNTEADWLWLSSKAGKAARWLGYIDFSRIVDARNSEPVVVRREHVEPEPYISVGVEVEIPDAASIEPRAMLYGFHGLQPYKLVLFGEKTSLEPVLAPIASAYQADLYLPTGEASDTMIHQMAAIGAQDGRPMVISYLSDCDPAGWQMAVSVARKLQGFKALLFPELQFEVRPIALTPDQVRLYGLPSTPLKETEKRADNWVRAMGVEQTEIDALATLQPDLLRDIVREALAPFYDHTLHRRVQSSRRDWQEQAQAQLEEQIDGDQRERLVAEAAEKLATLRDEVAAINDGMRVAVGDDIVLPTPVIPEPVIDTSAHGLPLVDSEWAFAEQSRQLIAHKEYRNGDGER
ncbi:MAG: hypothetical protein WKF99_00330 [Solirubrobacteraceae bacterium]